VTTFSPKDNLLHIGLTGGIASGKSVVADMFSARGIPVIDTDLISREVVEPGKPGLQAVIQEFGSKFLRADGTLDRPAMRKQIFSDPRSRICLEKILHPLIRNETIAQMKNAGGPYQIIAVPLLAETDFADFVDRILVIDCPMDICRERLLARDAETEDSVARIFSTQASREERLRIANDVIVNDGSLQDTERAVDNLHQRYLGMSADT
jgi:dephospho-CoA kinase